jgi:hypothetical protein
MAGTRLAGIERVFNVAIPFAAFLPIDKGNSTSIM